MKMIRIPVVLGLFLILKTFVATAGPPEWDYYEFYPAVKVDGFTCYVDWVDWDGFLIAVPLNDVTMVVDTSHQFPVEDLLVNCHGYAPLGEVAVVIDDMGNETEAELATTRRLCELYPGPYCRGNGKGAVQFTHENSGGSCVSNTPTGWIFTQDYVANWSPSGRVTFNCHFRGE